MTSFVVVFKRKMLLVKASTLGVSYSHVSLTLRSSFILSIYFFVHSFYLQSPLIHILKTSERNRCKLALDAMVKPVLKSIHSSLFYYHLSWSESTKFIELSYILHHTHSFSLFKPKKLLVLGPLDILKIIFSIHKVLELSPRQDLLSFTGFNHFPPIFCLLFKLIVPN